MIFAGGFDHLPFTVYNDKVAHNLFPSIFMSYLLDVFARGWITLESTFCSVNRGNHRVRRYRSHEEEIL